MKRPLTYIFVLTIVVMLQAQTGTTVYWHSPIRFEKTITTGLNLCGQPATYADNMDKLESIRTLNPSIIRIKTPAAWLSKDNTWNADSICAAIGAIRSVQSGEILIAITICPNRLDANNDGAPDHDKFQDYADWCAELVNIVNITYNYNIKYWTPFSELDSIAQMNGEEIANLFNQCAYSMLNIDPAIDMGGGEFKDISDGQLLNDFLINSKQHCDFFTFHQYNFAPQYHLQTMSSELQSQTRALSYLRARLDSLQLFDLPIWITELNVIDNNEAFAKNDNGPELELIINALSIKNLTEKGLIDACILNGELSDATDIQGYHTNSHPLSMMYYLVNKYLSGTPVHTATQRIDQVNLLAVDAGQSKNVLLINQTDQYQMVDVAFEGWNYGSKSFLCYTLTSEKVNIDRQIYSSNLVNIELAPYSLKLLSFTQYTSVFQQQEEETLPLNYYLSQPYPNPFNSTSIIQFSAQEQQNVNIALYNSSGQMINELFNGAVNANLTYTLQIDGSELASGQYQIVILGEHFTALRSLVYIK